MKFRGEKMTILKRLSALCVVSIITVSMVMGQSAGSGQEMSVEESYLLESMELIIIREQSRTDSRDQKQMALRYIGDAISRGNTGEEIRSALEYLALEGVINQTRENGRLVNNFSDIRKQAVTYLGDLGTVEAKNTLIKVLLADPEPMVLQEAVKSLAKTGINDNDETVAAIAWIVTRFDVLNPDNLLALSAVDAFEKFASANNGIRDPNVIRVLLRISEGSYIKPVQERAKRVIADLRKYSVQNAQNAGRQ
ncbi:hypothetical protein FACS189450_02330 [Spirochaetia bacterium]|nr:hypothetical protein FACS189450_02330 [Spirochaetia bacterium]